MLQSRRPSSSLRPPALSRKPPPQRQHGAHDSPAESSGGGHGRSRVWGLSPVQRRGSWPGAKRQPETPRDLRRRGAPRASAAASPSGFLFLSEVFSPTPLLLLLVLPPPRPLPSLRPAAAVTATGRELAIAEPQGALRGIFGPGGGAHWAKGRRGARGEGSGRPIRERRAGAELDRGGATRGGRATRQAAAVAAGAGARMELREALGGRRAPQAGGGGRGGAIEPPRRG